MGWGGNDLMATLRDMPAALRKYGLRVQVLPDWLSNDHGAMGPIRTIVWHHTAGAARGNYPSLNIVRFGRSDLPGPLAQLGLARDGSVIVFSAGVAWHAGAVRNGDMDNYNAIGIEAESTGYGDWTQEQIIAYPRAGAAMCDLFNLPAARNLAHFEICDPPGRKIDAAQLPGGMNEQRRRVAALLMNGGSDMPLTDADKRWIRQAIHDEVWVNARLRIADSPPGKNGKFKLEPAHIAVAYIVNRLRNYMNADRKVIYAAVTNGVAQVLKAVNATVTEVEAQRITDDAVAAILAELPTIEELPDGSEFAEEDPA